MRPLPAKKLPQVRKLPARGGQRQNAAGKLFHVEQFGVNGKALENFVASGFVLFGLQLRKIMAICALLQRMGIFGGEREISCKFRSFGGFGGIFCANQDS